jgi:hypothetical protein
MAYASHRKTFNTARRQGEQQNATSSTVGDEDDERALDTDSARPH